jgi:hypothetical protein
MSKETLLEAIAAMIMRGKEIYGGAATTWSW